MRYLLEMLENWLSDCLAFVKWHKSHLFVFSKQIHFSERQGFVLSPYRFSVYIDDIHRPTYIHTYIYDVSKLCDSRNGSFVLL